MPGKKKKYDVQKATEEEMVSLKPLGSETDMADDPYLQPVSERDCNPEESAAGCAEITSSDEEGYEEPAPGSSKELNLYEEISDKKPKKDGEAPSPPPLRKETKAKKKAKKNDDSSKVKNAKKKAAACKAPTPSKGKKAKKSAATFDPPSCSSEMDLPLKEPAPVMAAPLTTSPQAPAASQQVSINVSNLMGITKTASNPNSKDATPKQLKKLKSRNKCLNFCNCMMVLACAGLMSLLVVIIYIYEKDFPQNQRNPATNDTVENIYQHPNETCYTGSTSGRSWDECWKYCAKNNTILVEIEDKESLDKLFDQHNTTRRYWTGGRRLDRMNFIWDHSRDLINTTNGIWQDSAPNDTNKTRVSVNLTGLIAAEASEQFHCICELKCSA